MIKTPAEIRATPLKLPPSFEWVEVDLASDEGVGYYYDIFHVRLLKYIICWQITTLRMMVLNSVLLTVLICFAGINDCR